MGVVRFAREAHLFFPKATYGPQVSLLAFGFALEPRQWFGGEEAFTAMARSALLKARMYEAEAEAAGTWGWVFVAGTFERYIYLYLGEL